ncbi:hypothetical protein TNCV_3779241 [Trichonephila clavipes]|nr:hypothetical protein TNCV_3779241 [Trichonephila clavipes]
MGSNPGEDMDVCKCIVPSRHSSTSNSRRAASPLVKLVEGEEWLEALRWIGSGGLEVACHLYKSKVVDSTPAEVDRLSGCENRRHACHMIIWYVKAFGINGMPLSINSALYSWQS